MIMMDIGSWEDILEKFEGTDELLEFHLDSDEDAFYVGAVKKVFAEVEDDDDFDDDDFFEDSSEEASAIVAAVDADGNADGLVWFPLFNIEMICEKTSYLTSRQEFFAGAKLPDLPDETFYGLDALLQMSRENDKILSVEMGEDLLYGVVLDFDDLFVKMECVTENGAPDGIAYFEKDRVDICKYQGVDELAVEALRQE